MDGLAERFTPMWIAYLVAAALAGTVAVLVLRSHRRGWSFRDTTGTNVFTVAGATLFAISLLGLLGLSSPTVVDWWQALAVRVGLHLGSVVVLEVGIVLDAREGGTLGSRPVWLMMAALFVIGTWLSWSSARDLLEGPLVLHSSADLTVERTRGGGRGGSSIFATLVMKAPDGSRVTLDMQGWGAERAEAVLSKCDAKHAFQITVLRHTERVLDVACK